MNIKNYTSTVDAGKSMARIQEMLVEIGADNINMKYENKQCTGITFLLFDPDLNRTVPFHMEVQSKEIFDTLWKEVKRPQPTTKQNLLSQANRTAWKIMCDLT